LIFHLIVASSREIEEEEGGKRRRKRTRRRRSFMNREFIFLLLEASQRSTRTFEGDLLNMLNKNLHQIFY